MLISQSFEERIKNKNVFVDTNLLSRLLSEVGFMEPFIQLAVVNGTNLIIDPLIRFEFMRGIYNPPLVSAMEEFLKSFSPATNHQQIYQKVSENALALSMVYMNKFKLSSCSFVDLFLGGRIMLYDGSLHLTANKKDFPSPIFKLLGIITHEKNHSDTTNYYLLSFDKGVFDAYFKDINSIKSNIPPNISSDSSVPF